ncbi:O-acetyltransferase PaAT-2 [Diaporthe amygdali]|uniref:O-acetyltransferase PaAT-2 n=1 Tax=Phomopsis amygdali TaxID=1214568 RepID=UPI0022FE4FA5|nr:O-acetyltransferase PaAT-2 [Diaporthe amygdali]KAJ0121348.1 O-acetyltransferase PaAT-2 [Diaporthe amygdali]
MSQTTVPVDRIVPFHRFDDAIGLRNSILVWTLRFDDVLDAAKLRDSLNALLSIGNWKRLGGRVRKKRDGKLEVHIPESFTPQHPAADFSHTKLDCCIDEHALGRRLPVATEKPRLHESSTTFHEFATRENPPLTIEDYCNSDLPQIGLHVVSFTDATLVSVSWPHTMSDAVGIQTLLINWSRVMAGREIEVQHLEDVESNPLDNLEAGEGGTLKQEEWILKSSLVSGIWFVIWVVRYIWTIIWVSQESKLIYLPARTIKALRREAEDSLVEQTQTLVPGHIEKPFVSDGDVITAWAVRMACLHQASQQTSQQSITIINALDVRARLPDLFKQNTAYVGNFAFALFTTTTVGRVMSTSLGELAHTVRQSLLEQAPQAQIRAMFQELRKTRMGALVVGTATSSPLIFSNWSKTKICEVVDFSPAVIRRGKQGPVISAPGKPVYHHSLHTKRSQTARDAFNILGKDPAGNYWIAAWLPPRAWPRIEEEMQKLP